MLRRGSSPRARGAARPAEDIFRPQRIIPARAGSSLTHLDTPSKVRDHPRARGEQRHHASENYIPRGSSPRARGAVLSQHRKLGYSGIIPARAGSSCLKLLSGILIGDHPRARGEQGRFLVSGRRRLGSSPRARGAGCPVKLGFALRGIIPARAGSRLKNPC